MSAEPIHVSAFSLCLRIAKAVEGALPAGFRGDIRIVVDGGPVEAYNVSVQFKPPQPKAGMKV